MGRRGMLSMIKGCAIVFIMTVEQAGKADVHSLILNSAGGALNHNKAFFCGRAVFP